MDRLLYVTNSRLPTEKAHGYQICKMCEALSENGVEVLLLHPYRHQNAASLRCENIFDYYGIQSTFEVRTLQNLDIVRLERFFRGGTFKGVFFTHALAWGLYATLNARREGANLFYTRDSAMVYWLVRFGLPTIFEAHVVPKGGQRWLLERVAKSKWLRLVLLLSSTMQKQFEGMAFPSEKMMVLPHGVDLTRFAGVPSKEECRQRLGLPFLRKIIGYIGRFEAVGMEKGVNEVVQAMSHLDSVNGAEPLLLCVGGPLNVVPGYLRLASKNGIREDRLRFLERVPNAQVPYWIRACDIVVLPLSAKYAENVGAMPLKLFEYMAASVPMVASDLPSIRDVLRHGENAWLVEPGNPKALAEGIRQVSEMPGLGSRIAEQARRDVSQYTWDERAKRILRIIERGTN